MVDNSVQGSSRVQIKDDGKWELWGYNQLLILFCLVGLGLSLYAYVVELHMEKNPGYKPYCDVGPGVSCTKVFGSSYGKGFGIFDRTHLLYKPNSFFGIVFYSMIATLSLSNSPLAVKLSLFSILLSNFASLYFAYILYFVLNDLCVVCISTYVVNAINLILITRKYKKTKQINATYQNQQIGKSGSRPKTA